MMTLYRASDALMKFRTDWDSERLWRTYIMLTNLEAVFRSFKPVLSAVEGSELGLRPVYHHKEIRVDGHLFITVLAYQFVQIIRKQLQEHDIQGRWSSLREILSVQQRVTASFQRANGGALHIQKATRPEPELAAIYQALNLDPLPGGVQKTYVLRVSDPCFSVQTAKGRNDLGKRNTGQADFRCLVAPLQNFAGSRFIDIAFDKC